MCYTSPSPPSVSLNRRPADDRLGQNDLDVLPQSHTHPGLAPPADLPNSLSEIHAPFVSRTCAVPPRGGESLSSVKTGPQQERTRPRPHVKTCAHTACSPRARRADAVFGVLARSRLHCPDLRLSVPRVFTVRSCGTDEVQTFDKQSGKCCDPLNVRHKGGHRRNVVGEELV